MVRSMLRRVRLQHCSLKDQQIVVKLEPALQPSLLYLWEEAVISRVGRDTAMNSDTNWQFSYKLPEMVTIVIPQT